MSSSSKRVRILWVEAVNYVIEVEGRYQFLGIFHIIAQLRRRFPNDLLEFRIVNRSVDKELRSFRPHITAISSVSQNYGLAKEYARIARANGSRVIVGGIHISAMPHTLTKCMDVGVIGEGEVAFGDIAELYLRTGTLDPDSLSRIPGLVYWEQGRLEFSEVRQPVPDLDLLAHPDRTMMNPATRLNALSSRSCPFRCVFCSPTRIWGKARYFSPDYVCEEVQRILWSTNRGLVMFWDDLFVASYRRLGAIYTALETGKLLGKFRFTCTARSNLLTEDTVKLLKEMGCVSVAMGLESGNDEVLRYLKGQSVKVSNHISAIRLLKQHKIGVTASFIIGSPRETKAQIMDTYHFIRQNEIDAFEVTLLTPLPGTPVWEYAERRGLVHDQMDWDRLNWRFSDHFESAIILSEHLTRKELADLYMRFKRLSWVRLVKNIWRSVYVPDLPTLLWGQIREKASKFLSGLGS